MLVCDAVGTLCSCLMFLVPCVGVWRSLNLVLVFEALGTLCWCLMLFVPCVGVGGLS